MPTSETWTVMSILNWSSDYLKGKGVDDARTVVEWLLCDTLTCSRMDLYLKFDRSMSESELATFRPMLLKCGAGQPVQQVVGSCEFYGLKLAVNDKVLIPRPETERLVEETLKRIPAIMETRKAALPEPKSLKLDEESEERVPAYQPPPEIRILDIGAGTGCISIALAMHVPQARITAVEISAGALDVLKRNIHFYNLDQRIRVIHRDILEYKTDEPFDIIVSNPPYIARQEMGSLGPNVAYFEPHMALSDSDDGLTFYRLFSEKFHEWLLPDGVALIEYGGNAQTSELKKIFSAYIMEIIKDFQHDDRVMTLKKREG